jgi:myo-inositol-1(or 4)-monophosphatase
LDSPKRAKAITQFDIKLELDVRCQKLIERRLRADFPEVGVLGEEGLAGDPNAQYRWVIDPIDGTVNFAYGIPHACVSIALQGRSNTQPAKRQAGRTAWGAEPGRLVKRGRSAHPSRSSLYPDGYQTLVGVVYEPFCDELWTATKSGPARLNGKVIHVSRRHQLKEAIVAVGLSKSREQLDATLPLVNHLARRVRKLRIMGAGALDLAYVACGRFDAYLERSISLWDVAAGGLILERAGGEVWRQPIAGEHKFRMIASNGRLGAELAVPGEWLDARR